MKTVLRFTIAAIVAAFGGDAFAGFSDGLDLDALNEMLEIDASIDQISISVNGERGGNVWQPADISAKKDASGNLTGEVAFNGGGFIEGINSAKGYIEFGKYDDEASLNAFFMRDDFLNSRGDIMYLIENLRDCYTKAEDKNASLLESVIEQVEANVEDYLANEGSGGKSSTASKMIAAYNKFYKSFENSVKNEENRKNGLIQKFESLKKSAANKNKQLILEAMMKVMMNNYNNTLKLENTVYANYEKFKQLRMSYLNSMNTLGAYLGSTNAMEFCSSGLKFEDMTESDLARWYKFSPPNPLFRDDDDKNSYETIGELGVFNGKTYDNIFRLIGSTYFVTYMDLEWMDRFAQTYDQGSFDQDNIRGFYEQQDAIGQNTVTNWYASHITAPKNWADNSTVVVKNGKFSAQINTAWSWDYDNGRVRNCYVQIGNASYTYGNGTFTPDADGTYYLHIVINNGTPTLTVSTTQSTSADVEVVVKVLVVATQSGVRAPTFVYGNTPFVGVYQ